MKQNLERVMEQFVKLDEKIAKLGNEEIFYELASESIKLGERIEGLQKELQEQLADLGDTTIHSMHDNVKGKIAAQNKKDIIEEVLGVEPKIKEETKR